MELTAVGCCCCRLVALSSASMVAAKEPPTFYYNKLCPFAHRAWLAISEKGIDYKPVHIDLKNKGQVTDSPLVCHLRSPTQRRHELQRHHASTVSVYRWFHQTRAMI